MAINSSFYGGRRGASFVIVKNYLDIPSMTEDFKNGNSFKDVAFDEYVIINNPRKNHPDNGKVFRRGYDYNSNRKIEAYLLKNKDENDNISTYSEVTEQHYKHLLEGDFFDKESDVIEAHGAEYIGCIIGPAGKAPLLTIGAYDAIREMAESTFEERRSNGLYSPDNVNPGLIPGKEGNNYNDSIEWCCVSIRNDQYGDDTQAYIGFKFPYLVTQMQTSQVEPYDTNGDIADMSNIYRDDDGTHPYYNKWHLDIPKGVKGDTIRNLKVTTFNTYQQASNSNQKTALYKLTYNNGVYVEEELLGGNTVNYNFFKEHYGFIDEQIQENGQNNLNKLLTLLGNKQILVYEIHNYDNKQAGQKKYYFLGDFDQIKDISYEDGKITFSFTNSDNKTFPFKHVERIQFDPGVDDHGELSSNAGMYKVIYNTKTNGENDTQIGYIPFVRSMTYDESQGNISYTIAGEENGITVNLVNNFKFIRNIFQDESSGKIIIIYNLALATENIENEIKSRIKTDFFPGKSEFTQEDLEKIDALYQQIGNHEYSLFPIKAVSSIKAEGDKINVYYVDGTVNEVAQNFYTISRFEYDPTTATLTIQKSNENEPNVYTLNYPKEIIYNKQDNMVQYKLQDGVTTKNIGTLPLLTNITLADNLDLYVKMNSPEAASLITEGQNVYDITHPKSENWINLGNLSKPLNFMNMARNFTHQDFINELTNAELTDLRSRIEEYTNYTKDQLSLVIDCLNALYPNGAVLAQEQNGNVIERKIVTAGEDNNLKDFFAYDQFKVRPVFNADGSYDESGAVTLGSWYFLGRIESAKNVAVAADASTTDLDSGGILLTNKMDILSISYPDAESVNPIRVKNKMTEIKQGCAYKNKILDTAMMAANLSIRMGGTELVSSVFNEVTKEIYISSVTNDIIIKRV